jgi:hypothetical protein
MKRWLAGITMLAGALVATEASAQVRVAVVTNSGNDTAAAAAAQLNDDTYFNFTASVVTPAGVDSALELGNYDVVVFGDSGNNNNGWTDAMATALVTFVQANGRGVVSTGWGDYAITSSSVRDLALDQVMPIDSAPDAVNSYCNAASTITITGPAHPVTAGLSTLPDPAANVEISIFAPDAMGGTVLGTVTAGTCTNATRNAIVVGTLGAGRTVYLGQVFLAASSYGNSGLRSGVHDRLFEQAVKWASGGAGDSDGDGLVDTVEVSAGTSPLDADSDDDNLGDATEYGGGMAPLDTNGDGTIDALDDDSDGDGLLDIDEAGDTDLATPALDTDGDGLPNYRDLDSDGDGVLDGVDNCVTNANATQSDLDGDGDGDACDDDADGDGLLNAVEAAIATNPLAVDTDGDRIGDAEEVGADPSAPSDTDGDGTIDAVDDDSDDDGVLDLVEAGDTDLATVAVDTDGDGAPNYQDADSDDDTIVDGADNCALAANTDQSDTDGDGRGDFCDADLDGDGVANPSDNCALVANAEQLDTDGDGQGDACDADDDGDGVSDVDDACPLDSANACGAGGGGTGGSGGEGGTTSTGGLGGSGGVGGGDGVAPEASTGCSCRQAGSGVGSGPGLGVVAWVALAWRLRGDRRRRRA